MTAVQACGHRAVVLALLLVLGACGEPPPSLPQLAEDAVILSFGDSLTHGTGARPEESYPAVLERLVSRKVIRSGVPGELSAQGLARLPAELLRHAPALLILCHGGNDLLRKRPLAALEANLEAMIELARAQGTAVLLIGVPRPALLGLDSAEPYVRIADKLGLPFIPDALPEILGDNSLKSDPIHPNAAGYARLAHAIAELLGERGALPRPLTR